MKIRHAKLVDVTGRPAKYGGFTIVPATVELDGMSFSPSLPLAELARDRIPPVLRLPIEHGYDAAWVRARLPSAFGISPEPSEGEKQFLLVGFVAVSDGSEEGVAFECSDHYGKTSLLFSPEEENAALMERVADAFWGVLLSEPDQLEDFEVSVMHSGAPITLHFGCENGEPYCRETPD